jgi:hypothetical protein
MSNLFLPGRQGLYRKHRLTGTAESLIESFIYWHSSTNHGRICYSDENFVEMTGFGRTAVQRAIRDLKAIGFIKTEQLGSNLREIKVDHEKIMADANEFFESRRAPKRELEVELRKESSPSSEKRAPRAPKRELPIEDIKKEDTKKKTKGTARGAARLDLIKELNLKSEELIIGEDGLFGDEKPPEWRNALLGWIKDRIDPSRVQIIQPKKPSKIVNLPQLTKLANQADRWEKEIESNPGSAAALEVAIVEAVEESKVNGWSSVHPEREFERIFRDQVKAGDEKTQELVNYVVTSLGGNVFKDYGAKKIAAEKLRGKTMKEAQYHVGRLKDLRKKYGVTATLGTQIATLFDGQESQAGDLLGPDQLRQWKQDRGDL